MAYSSIFEGPPSVNGNRATSSIFKDGRFHNAAARKEFGLAAGLKAMVRNVTDKSPQAAPSTPIETPPLTREELHNAPDQSLWRLGHSTVLLKLDGKFWLTDPMFAERASPVGFVGPKRFHSAPIALADLPEIEAVIISHDHYDHLDHDTILAIQDKVGTFVTPLGVGERLIDWGIAASKVRQLDWWEETRIAGLRLVATPARHFSGRTLLDNDRTLWSSWVLIAPTARVFFSGDSGYFDGFKAIGEKFGPFDVTLLENGAYNEAWADIHMHPEQTVQAHIDLRGKRLVPIHNGTFDLALHAWTEPLEQVTKLSAQRDVAISTPRFGERLDIGSPDPGQAWWQPDASELALNWSPASAPM
ncbi:MAG: MBL fold metallo-hydrolase [Propionivibrio sp.]|nr:MBL fold metallo-hydrolase [Propionivibrio sp.]MBP6710756.1 MBL fold metallo-hydrolase [Propionivibrio sp.]